ncbi:zinc-binding domain-containing protein [Lophiotrema nucula]|uniref:Zinc-binding domain-containing protein n=1 Tax=Lophiotrema nucula TaxID=690887 RepID=A0A6A5YZ15_9PLEO|nr:zinc-binding domain-containing protein [Lophiotrema nucula]
MYPSLHNDVSDRLREDNLSFSFYRNDDQTSCMNEYDTTIMGRFACRNEICMAVWTSKQIAITIRRYPNERYNARVYHQSCKGCGTTTVPQLDHSYAERVAYRLKKWCGVQMEVPPFSGRSDGPHRSDLCEGCKQGHCSTMGLYI